MPDSRRPAILWILNRDEYSSDQIARLRSRFRLEFWATRELLDGSIDAVDLNSVEALLCGIGTSVDRQLIECLPNLRVIASPTTGIDHVDSEEAQRRQITLLTLREQRDEIRQVSSTAELTWLMILALARRLPAASSSVSAGLWERVPVQGRELRDMTLGIVGCGRLGSSVAHFGEAFGMKVIAHDTGEITGFARARVEHVSALELLRSADVVSIHLPLNESTRNWLDSDRVSILKDSAIVVNTARGEVVDEVALLDRLRLGHLYGVGLDVLRGDPAWEGRIPTDHYVHNYLHGGLNLIVTPHVGGFTSQAVRFTRDLIVSRLEKL